MYALADIKATFLILLGLLLLSSAFIVVLAPESLADYTVIDTAFHKTDHRLIGRTAYNFNNATEIAKFPKRIEGWKGIDFRYPKRVYEALEADIILSRAYSKNSNLVWMDIINSDKRKSFHNPKVCYGNRWNIVNETVEEIPMERSSAVIFDKIYVNRLDLEGKKDPEKKLVVLYWFIFKGGQGVTMIRLTSPVKKDYDSTYSVMEEFTKDVMSLMYTEIKRQRSMGEVWVEEYGVKAYAGIFSLFLPSVILIVLGVRMNKRE
ncbi:MAG: exosortase-associated EpsI family protein [Archaeoglobus sp.]|nr:exosortase-associated EpsI family protein [Archaeoglobus sp.]